MDDTQITKLKIDETKNAVLNDKISNFFIILDEKYLHSAAKQADITPNHANKIVKYFIKDGYYEKGQKKKRTFEYSATEKGKELIEHLKNARGC